MQKILLLLLILPLILFGKIKHPINLPEYDDIDANATISSNASIANFFNNPGAMGARPEGSGTAYNRYDLDVLFDSDHLFFEADIAVLTDKELSKVLTSLSEMDRNIVLGYHINDKIDTYIEDEHESPYDHTLTRSYSGIGTNYTYSNNDILGNELDTTFDIEKIIKNRDYAARPDGTGFVNMIYTIHIDYDLPSKFSCSAEGSLYTDKNKWVEFSEWDQLFQLNYKVTNNIMLSLFRETDRFIDLYQKSQSFEGLQLLYAF